MEIDQKDLDKMAKVLRKRPMTVDQLAEIFPRKKRAIYRWLNKLEERGEPIYRPGVGNPAAYHIAD